LLGGGSSELMRTAGELPLFATACSWPPSRDEPGPCSTVLAAWSTSAPGSAVRRPRSAGAGLRFNVRFGSSSCRLVCLVGSSSRSSGAPLDAGIAPRPVHPGVVNRLAARCTSFRAGLTGAARIVRCSAATSSRRPAGSCSPPGRRTGLPRELAAGERTSDMLIVISSTDGTRPTGSATSPTVRGRITCAGWVCRQRPTIVEALRGKAGTRHGASVLRARAVRGPQLPPSHAAPPGLGGVSPLVGTEPSGRRQTKATRTIPAEPRISADDARRGGVRRRDAPTARIRRAGARARGHARGVVDRRDDRTAPYPPTEKKHTEPGGACVRWRKLRGRERQAGTKNGCAADECRFAEARRTTVATSAGQDPPRAGDYGP